MSHSFNAIRALQRVFGTLLGVVLFALIRMADATGAWLVATLVLLQFAIEVVVARHYALAPTFITPTALTIAAAARTSAPGPLVRERIVDTLFGAAVAILVLWISEWSSRRRKPMTITENC